MKGSLRFRILARDKFTCQYCGRSAPDVVLEVDHILPRSAGGRSIDTNLLTSCLPCNRGKRVLILESPPSALPLEQPKRAIVVHAQRQRVRRRTERPAPVSSTGYKYIGPDEFIPKFICSVCGFLNQYESDECSCWKPDKEREEDLPHCGDCEEVLEEGEDGSMCGTCAWYCLECTGELKEPDYGERQTCERCTARYYEVRP